MLTAGFVSTPVLIRPVRRSLYSSSAESASIHALAGAAMRTASTNGAAPPRHCGDLLLLMEMDKHLKKIDPEATLEVRQKEKTVFDFVRRAPFCDAFLRKSNQIFLTRTRACVGLVRA